MGIQELFNRSYSHDRQSIWESVFQGVRDRIAALCAYPLPDVSFAPDPLIRAGPPETAEDDDAFSNWFDPPAPISDDEVEVGFSLWCVHYPWTVMNAAHDDLDRRFSIRFKEELFKQIAKGDDEAVARMAGIIEQRCLCEMTEGFVRHHLTGIENDFHRDAATFCDNGNGISPILTKAQMTSMAREVGLPWNHFSRLGVCVAPGACGSFAFGASLHQTCHFYGEVRNILDDP